MSEKPSVEDLVAIWLDATREANAKGEAARLADFRRNQASFSLIERMQELDGEGNAWDTAREDAVGWTIDGVLYYRAGHTIRTIKVANPAPKGGG